MFVDRCTTKGKDGKVHFRALIRDSYRENGKVKQWTMANISKCSQEETTAWLQSSKQECSGQCDARSIVREQGKTRFTVMSFGSRDCLAAEQQAGVLRTM